MIKNIHQNKKIDKLIKISGILFFALIFAIIIIILFYSGNNHGPHLVIFDRNGFEPYKIVIHKGETVTFVNHTGGYIWPASDMHPLHLLYPQFDPKKPIPPNGNWSFKFDRVGAWTYHNHLLTFYTGIVEVLDKNKNSLEDNYSCESKDKQYQLACWESMIQVRLEQKGITGAFDLVNKLFVTQPEFAKNCHDYVHWIGQYSYIYYYQKTGKIKVPNNAGSCGNGFYHGFMETFVRMDPNYTDIRNFCEQIRKQVGNQSAYDCYHGIGHGLVGIDPQTWGNAKLMTETSLKTCGDITKEEENFRNCESGIFGNVAEFMYTGQYDLKINKTDPLYLCREMEDKYKSECYTQMTGLIANIYNSDIVKEIKFINGLEDKKYAINLVIPLGGNEMINTLGNWDFDKEIKNCQLLTANLYQPCLESFLRPIIEISAANNDKYEGEKFCSSNALKSEDKNYCLSLINKIKL